MKLKEGASLVGVQWQMFAAAVIVEPIFNKYGQDLVITSGSDGMHPDKKNIHGRGFALDCRTRDLKTIDVVTKVADEVRATLAPGYDVVVETTHIHLEWDPKAGEVL